MKNKRNIKRKGHAKKSSFYFFFNFFPQHTSLVLYLWYVVLFSSFIFQTFNLIVQGQTMTTHSGGGGLLLLELDPNLLARVLLHLQPADLAQVRPLRVRPLASR
jgi:hypothetical protein